MNLIKQHFEQEARAFDRIILELIPYYSEMVRALVSAIPFSGDASIRVADLGCGTGTVAKGILEAFPKAEVVCVDLAENMIAVAQGKLAHSSRVEYLVGDFSTFNSHARYDVVVSSLALHHLATDEDKESFYRDIYNSLNAGGVFYNADVVLGSTDFLQALYMRRWREFMCRSISAEEVEGRWIAKYYSEDRPARLGEQLSWLAQIGFSGVDVIWKYYNFAVYGGIKGGRPPG